MTKNVRQRITALEKQVAKLLKQNQEIKDQLDRIEAGQSVQVLPYPIEPEPQPWWPRPYPWSPLPYPQPPFWYGTSSDSACVDQELREKAFWSNGYDG